MRNSPAAAKSLQSCLTLCDPINGSLPGSAIPGILQARTLEWVATSVLGILEPLTAIFIGTLVFKEAFTLNVAIGVALILFAILFMILTEKKA